MNTIHLRTATVADLPQICELFRQTVLYVNRKDYTPEQVEAWSAASHDTAAWTSRIQTQHFLLAFAANENDTGDALLGFASMAMGGYFDVLFVHHNWQGRGVAKALATALEQWAKNKGLVLVATDASITAKPFFERRGYLVVAEQQRILRNQAFINYSMKKWL